MTSGVVYPMVFCFAVGGLGLLTVATEEPRYQPSDWYEASVREGLLFDHTVHVIEKGQTKVKSWRVLNNKGCVVWRAKDKTDLQVRMAYRNGEFRDVPTITTTLSGMAEDPFRDRYYAFFSKSRKRTHVEVVNAWTYSRVCRDLLRKTGHAAVPQIPWDTVVVPAGKKKRDKITLRWRSDGKVTYWKPEEYHNRACYMYSNATKLLIGNTDSTRIAFYNKTTAPVEVKVWNFFPAPKKDCRETRAFLNKLGAFAR